MKSKQAKWKNPKSEKNDFSKGTKCYKCQGYSHFAKQSANKKKKSKKNVLNTTWDDESSEEKKEEEKTFEIDPCHI